MYNKIYEILEEKGRIKTAIILDGPDMGKKCIVRQPGNPDAAAQEKSLIPRSHEYDSYTSLHSSMLLLFLEVPS